MGRVVIVAYRPKPGKQQALETFTQKHIEVLRGEDLVTDRPSIAMRAGDGTVVEVFEWKSPAAIESAHSNSAVGALWAEYAEIADYVPIASVAEAAGLFSEFEALPALKNAS